MQWVSIELQYSPHSLRIESFARDSWQVFQAPPSWDQFGVVTCYFPIEVYPRVQGIWYTQTNLLSCLLSLIRLLFFFYDCNLWRHVDISIKRLLFKWCSLIRNSRLNLNDFYNCKLLVKSSISTTVCGLELLPGGCQHVVRIKILLLCCKNCWLYEVSASCSSLS